VLLLLRFCAQLTWESTTAQVDTCTVYQKKVPEYQYPMYHSIGIWFKNVILRQLFTIKSRTRTTDFSAIDHRQEIMQSSALLLYMSLKRPVYLAGQRFRGLYGPGIFYNTHAARAHASAAAGMHSSCFQRSRGLKKNAWLIRHA
jgi:hypothetical protein